MFSLSGDSKEQLLATPTIVLLIAKERAESQHHQQLGKPQLHGRLWV
jgi:hypothetical protein